MWNPEIPTQFMVANDDDKNPSFNIWDLRNSSYPVQSYPNIHNGGILSISWCLSDPNLIVSTGKDQRCVVTNHKTSEIVMEFPDYNIYNRILWSQQLNGRIAGLTATGSTEILQMEPRTKQQIGENAIPDEELVYATPQYSEKTNSPYVPKWYKPRCGASFGFGGKLVTFHGKCLKVVTEIKHQTEKDLVQDIKQFDEDVERAVSQGSLDALIEQKAKEIE